MWCKLVRVQGSMQFKITQLSDWTLRREFLNIILIKYDSAPIFIPLFNLKRLFPFVFSTPSPTLKELFLKHINIPHKTPGYYVFWSTHKMFQHKLINFSVLWIAVSDVFWTKMRFSWANRIFVTLWKTITPQTIKQKERKNNNNGNQH